MSREVIVGIGDRRNSGFCLKCGTTLIHPFNDYQCCVECTNFIVDCIKKLDYKKHHARDGKVGGSAVVNKANVARQVVPLGVPIK